MALEFQTAAYSVGNVTPVKILDGLVAPCGVDVAIKVVGSSVYLGGAGVSAANGFLHVAGSTPPLVIRLAAYQAADLYALADSATATTVRVLIGLAV